MTLPKNHSQKLRTGFTTGTCATAAAVTAWMRLHGESVEAVRIVFPDGHTRALPVDKTDLNGEMATACIIKDGGDDIDCTHGALISARVSEGDRAQATAADFIETCGAATLILRGAAGIGIVTRRGLDVPVGKWAINPVPRKMLIENLAAVDAGKSAQTWLVEISIENGDTLAKKTLNPVLGIEGGLSILGTSGIVIPCSHKAYIATIKTLLRGASESGLTTAVLVTGGRTHKALRTLYPAIDEIAFVRFGDFIKDALNYCHAYQFKTVVIGCMPGKLAKYAQGHRYTHAHTVTQSMSALADLLERAGLSATLCDSCRQTRSVREFLDPLEPKLKKNVLDLLKGQARANLNEWAGDCHIELKILDFNGEYV